jgi:uncharacterized protein
MKLLPRQEKFFHLFLDHARIIREASQCLLDGAKAGNSSLKIAAERIQELEHAGDEVTHDVYTRLNHTFITPIDPEDIHNLSSALDDVLDAIEEAAHRIVAYRLECIPRELVEICGVVNKCTASIEQALSALEKDQKSVLNHCIEINRLEDDADRMVRQVVADLFAHQSDPITLIKYKEIYEFLEQATDRSEDVADVLQNVVVKNS